MLLDSVPRLCVLRVSSGQSALQRTDMCVLAAETEHGGSGGVGAVEVDGEQSAERLGILPRAANISRIIRRVGSAIAVKVSMVFIIKRTLNYVNVQIIN